MPKRNSSNAGLRMRRLALAGALLALPLLWTGPASAEQLAALDQTRLFGSTEIHSANLKMFPKWRGALERFRDELLSCSATKCKKKQWDAMIEQLRGRSPMEQLRHVNAKLNDKRYITDPVNWNLPDYWATPFQFLRKNGDCEDYAISKYLALREIGIDVDDMRIVVLNDLNLGIAHAVLAVYVNGEPYILDNQTSKVVPASAIRHYQPVYSINENGWWLHRS